MSQAASSPMDPKSATTCVPSVAGVEFACDALVWRFTFGRPVNAVLSHRIFPVFLSRQNIFQVCSDRSSTGFTSP